jgi:hypothetical protein
LSKLNVMPFSGLGLEFRRDLWNLQAIKSIQPMFWSNLNWHLWDAIWLVSRWPPRKLVSDWRPNHRSVYTGTILSESAAPWKYFLERPFKRGCLQCRWNYWSALDRGRSCKNVLAYQLNLPSTIFYGPKY